MKQADQNGSTLIISLMILLVMTLVGLTSMRGTILEEKMAGNASNKNLSLQSAEVALRIGEAALSGFALPDFDGTDGHYQYNATDPSIIDWTNSDSIIDVPNDSVAGVAEQPKYYLEETTITKERNASGAGIGIGTTYREAESVKMYRVTARGVGGTTAARSILQSTVRQ